MMMLWRISDRFAAELLPPFAEAGEGAGEAVPHSFRNFPIIARLLANWLPQLVSSVGE